MCKVDIIDSLVPVVFSFSSRWDSKVEAANLAAHPEKPIEKPDKSACTLPPKTVYSYFCDREELTILLLQRRYYKSHVCLINKARVMEL